MFVSGATASALYHHHPHRDEEHAHPHSMEEQTRNAMLAIASILNEVDARWRDVIKVTKYLTDMRDADGMNVEMKKHFEDWQPASTMVCINRLSSPGARVELDFMRRLLPESSTFA
jgi:2-iminobutanoate/2-iminopropanoate deaminase